MSKQLKTPAASNPPSPQDRRAQRLEAALRLNLKKRKDQGRESTSAAPKPTPGES